MEQVLDLGDSAAAADPEAAAAAGRAGGWRFHAGLEAAVWTRAPGPEGTNDCVGRIELPENAGEVTHLYETTETRRLIDPNFGSRRLT